MRGAWELGPLGLCLSTGAWNSSRPSPDPKEKMKREKPPPLIRGYSTRAGAPPRSGSGSAQHLSTTPPSPERCHLDTPSLIPSYLPHTILVPCHTKPTIPPTYPTCTYRTYSTTTSQKIATLLLLPSVLFSNSETRLHKTNSLLGLFSLGCLSLSLFRVYCMHSSLSLPDLFFSYQFLSSPFREFSSMGQRLSLC